MNNTLVTTYEPAQKISKGILKEFSEKHSWFQVAVSALDLIIIPLLIHLLVIQYPMQFNGPPRNISNPCSASLCAARRIVVQLIQLHAFHALLLPSKYY